MKRLRVATIAGTRPEIIRLPRAIDALDWHSGYLLVHAGQSYDYELNGMPFGGLGVRLPDRFFEAAGTIAAETIERVISSVDTALAEIQSDAVLMLGDAKINNEELVAMLWANPIVDHRRPDTAKL